MEPTKFRHFPAKSAVLSVRIHLAPPVRLPPFLKIAGRVALFTRLFSLPATPSKVATHPQISHEMEFCVGTSRFRRDFSSIRVSASRWYPILHHGEQLWSGAGGSASDGWDVRGSRGSVLEVKQVLQRAGRGVAVGEMHAGHKALLDQGQN